MKPNHVTFTGIDYDTNLEELKVVSAEYACEWGILFSPAQQGLDPRYPAHHIIEAALSCDLMFSAHLCGEYAREVMETSQSRLDLSRFARVQVNHTKPDPVALARFSEKLGIPVIAQWRDSERFPESYEGVSWLYDTSGGRGTCPDMWPTNPSNNMVGYAGGINPTNVAEVLDAVKDLSPAGYWIDMETGVRTNNFLDLGKVRAVLSTAKAAA